MNAEEFTQKMMDIESVHGGDIEAAHGRADEVMCDLLRELGYGDGVDIFERMDRWYA